jgi:hypothetical protein
VVIVDTRDRKLLGKFSVRGQLLLEAKHPPNFGCIGRDAPLPNDFVVQVDDVALQSPLTWREEYGKLKAAIRGDMFAPLVPGSEQAGCDLD